MWTAIGLLVIFLVLVGVFIRTSSTPAPAAPSPKAGHQHGQPPAPAQAPAVQEPPPVPKQPEQRIAELRKKREDLEFSAALQREHGRTVLKEIEDLSREPLSDPEERQTAANELQRINQRIAELMERIEGVDAEIAKEEEGGRGNNLGQSAVPSPQEKPESAPSLP